MYELKRHSVCASVFCVRINCCLKRLLWKHRVVSLFQMMEDFSGLALPPLFGEHILEAELEPGGVELGPGEVRGWHLKLHREIQNLWCSLVGTWISWGWRSFLTGCVSTKVMEQYFTSSRCIITTSLCIKQIDSGVPLETSQQKQTDNQTQTGVVACRWSWAREAMSCQRIWHKRMKKEEPWIRGSIWLSAGGVKKLNRCVSFYMHVFGLL